MPESPKEKLVRICTELIAEATTVRETKFDTDIIGAPTFVDLQQMHKWWGKVKSFGHQLGTAIKPWNHTFDSEPERNTNVFVMRVQGTLEAIKHELENDHLASYTQIVRAETLADLHDQAQHLLQKGYYLAAGVIGRAILEEHLRNTCDVLSCSPSKSKPTLNDFNMALYGADHYKKTKMKQIDALASIGNDAAHNQCDAREVRLARGFGMEGLSSGLGDRCRYPPLDLLLLGNQ